METKSRYEVIAELEGKKRALINERDGLNDQLRERERQLKLLERHKSDNIMVLDRQIADKKEEVENYKSTLAERKDNITELIKSVDDSLERFNKLQVKS